MVRGPEGAGDSPQRGALLEGSDFFLGGQAASWTSFPGNLIFRGRCCVSPHPAWVLVRDRQLGGCWNRGAGGSRLADPRCPHLLFHTQVLLHIHTLTTQPQAEG